MADALHIEGKTLHPIKEAAQVVSYSRDYVTRLAREEKITAHLVGRQWFVDIDSLRHYAEVSAVEQELRKKQLSEERKRERQLREAAEQHNTLTLERVRPMHLQAAAVASLVLGFGLLMGWGAYFLSAPAGGQNVAQVGQSVPVVNRAPAEPVVPVVPQPASVADEDALVPEFSAREVMPLGDTANGVLVFPNATSTDVTALFSDKVEVVTLPNGEQVVWRVDAVGNRLGNPVPFVEVPINQANP
jgi:excisionase family DNA binding protein